jgi:hypothetical protein
MSRIRTYLCAAAVSAASVLASQNAHAGFTTVNPTPYSGERNIDHILGQSYGGTFSLAGNDYTNGVLTATRVDDSADQTFSGIVTSIKALARFAGFSQTFGVMNSAGDFTSLMTTSGMGYSITGSATTPVDLSDADYAFARTGGGTTVGSDTSLNSDSLDHMVTYLLSGSSISEPTYVLFFEDLLGMGGDRDFNDLAIELTFAGAPGSPAAVPLPPMAFVGLATLLGGAIFRKRIAKVVA